jgi:hypothetical protein
MKHSMAVVLGRIELPGVPGEGQQQPRYYLENFTLYCARCAAVCGSRPQLPV